MSIPVMKIFKESFSNFMEHKLSWLRLAFAPIVLYVMGFLVLLSLTLMGEVDAQGNFTGAGPVFGNLINIIISIIAGFSLYINAYRYGILNEGGDRWWVLQLNMRLLRMLGYTFLIVFFVIGFLLVAGGILYMLHLALESTAATVIVGSVFALIGAYMIFRLSLVYPMIAIEHERPLTTSWRMLEGNVMRLVGLVLLVALAVWGILLAGGLGIVLFGVIFYFISPVAGGVVAVLAAIPFILFVWLLNWAVTSKALSLVYLSFTEGKV